MSAAQPLIDFMKARHTVYVKRFSGHPYPWTNDPILNTYRFCNVYRELDKVTRWVHNNIRMPFADHPNLWFMLCAARQVNWPDSLEELIADKKGAWPHWKSLKRWDPERFRTILNERKARGEQVYTGAYMLTNVLDRSAPGPHDKPHFTAYRVLGSLLPLERDILAAAEVGMEPVHRVLRTGYGWGGFMAYEVVCDMRWTRYGLKWPDVNTFAHAGPGALRGLNRLAGRELNALRTEKDALDSMCALLALVRRSWPEPSALWPELELRAIEHSLCEFDKYERVRLGQGKPRARYHYRGNR